MVLNTHVSFSATPVDRFPTWLQKSGWGPVPRKSGFKPCQGFAACKWSPQGEWDAYLEFYVSRGSIGAAEFGFVHPWAKELHYAFFDNVVRGKSPLFRPVVRNGFAHFVRKVLARRKLLPGKFCFFAPLVLWFWTRLHHVFICVAQTVNIYNFEVLWLCRISLDFVMVKQLKRNSNWCTRKQSGNAALRTFHLPQ